MHIFKVPQEIPVGVLGNTQAHRGKESGQGLNQRRRVVGYSSPPPPCPAFIREGPGIYRSNSLDYSHQVP